MQVKVDFQHLKDAYLFQDLPDDALARVAEHCEYRELPAGETLFHQDDTGDALYILREGQVQVVRHYENGADVVLATEGPYYIVGDLSGIGGYPRTGSVVAVSDCTLIAINRDSFLQAVEGIPGVSTQVINHLVQRLYRMNLLVRENTIGNAEVRIANILLMLCGNQNGPISGEVYRRQIARAVGMEPDDVDRILKNWAQKGFVRVDGRQIEVLKADTLREIAGFTPPTSSPWQK
jgi:CRP/FNR family transcriptional regulator